MIDSLLIVCNNSDCYHWMDQFLLEHLIFDRYFILKIVQLAEEFMFFLLAMIH